MRISKAVLAAALFLLTAAPALAVTASSYGQSAVYRYPQVGRVLGYLHDGERVNLTFCTLDREWCRIASLETSLAGWVRWADVKGEALKRSVLPFSLGGLFPPPAPHR